MTVADGSLPTKQLSVTRVDELQRTALESGIRARFGDEISHSIHNACAIGI